MSAHLIVRAIVADSRHRRDFDTWYRDDHMAQVIEHFDLVRCWRSWSVLDPSVHYACYEFSDIADLQAMMNTATFSELVEDFSRTWDGKVTRERDLIASVQVHDHHSI
ncbi:MAG: hypothetical protein JWO15_1045 [Sphingomonadales bacterium]|nr:hypothetical protein [Sphingomonadales bacterium]